jgi:hypothetical protein
MKRMRPIRKQEQRNYFPKRDDGRERGLKELMIHYLNAMQRQTYTATELLVSNLRKENVT